MVHDLTDGGHQGADCTLDDVVIPNHLVSPNISGINSNNTSGTSANRKGDKGRKNNMSHDMNDLSAIYQQIQNGDSLNQTHLELIRKLTS